jgi:anaerobic magnesium-protoporphyrin IX monomethyl ester cyclase
MRILLLTPKRRFIANQFGVGYQIPLGLVCIGGPLADAGHVVKLIDNDLHGWPIRKLVAEIGAFAPDCIMLGHTGSTAAHDVCLRTASALRCAFPQVHLVYGGVYPSYADEESLRACPAIDVVVRGEGEQTVLDLVATWEDGQSLGQVAGITWRDGATIRANPNRPALRNLDNYRPGWELVEWDGYRLFGLGRSAGMQFSRGCPLTCTYCGQWLFWKQWRHRSPDNVVSELRKLAHEYGVKIVWFADENFGADREIVRELLEKIIAANLGLSLNINLTASSVVRDADLLPLYKQAGVDYVVMGIESLEDDVVEAVRKNNPYAISKQAVQLLRQHHIISLTNIIYGLEEESVDTIARKLRKMAELDSDILNACYITPHFWTADGKRTKPEDVIQHDQSKWTYRNQVVRTRQLSPLALFTGVKLSEALFHLRPKALARLFVGNDARVRRLLRASLMAGVRTVVAEVAEFVFKTTFEPSTTEAGDWKSRLRSLPKKARLIVRLRGRGTRRSSVLVRAGGRSAERLSGATFSRQPDWH